MEQAREVAGQVKVHCLALKDSPYPKGLWAAWVRGMCVQEDEQKVAPSKVEGVREKLAGEV